MSLPVVVESHNLSIAWAKTLLAAKHATPSHRITPMVVTILPSEGELNEEEVPEIRSLLDETLRALHQHECHTVANTIFPRSLWKAEADPEELYSSYLEILPTLHKYPGNYRGLYFERLIDFGNGGAWGTGRNQLKHILNTWHQGNSRRSALQASIFDPRKDHVHSKQLGFPCLDHVAFIPEGHQGLAVIGYYGLQYVLERGYGNYLGLIRLGKFMAHEMGLTLTRLTCVAGSASLKGKGSMSDIAGLVSLCGQVVNSESKAGT